MKASTHEGSLAVDAFTFTGIDWIFGKGIWLVLKMPNIMPNCDEKASKPITYQLSDDNL